MATNASSALAAAARRGAPAMPHGELAMPVLAGLQELAGRLHGERLLGMATEPALAMLERARVLLRTAYADDAEPDHTEFAQGGLAGWQMRAIEALVDARLDQSLSLAALADVARLSPSYLCRAFRRSCGCSPMQFVTQRRLKAAQTLLRQGVLPLREIALQCGFADQAHFTRVFHATTGETPRRWRQLWQHCAGAPAAPRAGLLIAFDAHLTG